MTSLLSKYDRLTRRVLAAEARTVSAKKEYDAAKEAEETLKRDLEVLRDALQEGLDEVEIEDPLGTQRDARSSDSGTPPSVQQLCRAFPEDGPMRIAEISDALSLSSSGVHNRLQRAMALGLVERVARSNYTLTDRGIEIRTRK